MRNLLYWFKINLLKAKPRKISVMILGKKNLLKYSLKIGSITIKGLTKFKWRSRITIDKALNFKKHIENLCRTAQYELHALRRIRKYLTLDKTKLLGNAFIDNQFNCAPLIWMFCHKTTYLKMQKNHHKTLKVIHQSDASYDDLLQLSNNVSLHQRHLRFLLTEIYIKILVTWTPSLCGHTSNTERFHITRDGVQYFSFHSQGLLFMVLSLCIFLGP